VRNELVGIVTLRRPADARIETSGSELGVFLLLIFSERT
jgi:hypothetical protein